MARQALLVSAFLLFLNVSLVLCRDDYQQYYSNHYSHHHHKSTPADSVSSTGAPVSLGEETPVSGSANDIAEKTTDEHVEKQHENSLFGLSADVNGSEKPVLQRSYDFETRSDFDYETANQIRVVSIVVSLVLCVIGLIIIFCCGKKIGRKVQTGYVVNSGGAQPGFAVSPAYSPQGVELR